MLFSVKIGAHILFFFRVKCTRIHVSSPESMEKKTKKGEKKRKKKPDEKIFLEQNIFPRGKSGKFSLNIFRGLIAR